MAMTNILFAWCWFLVGFLTGTIQGYWFHHDDWMGGYDSWPRRLTRLGHVAFFGTGGLNLGFGLTALVIHLDGPLLNGASLLLMIGAVMMSSICYLCAWRKPLRHLFFIPIVSLAAGVGLFVFILFNSHITGN